MRRQAHSAKTAKTISDTNSIKFEYNATSSNKIIALSRAYIGVDGKAYSGSSITLAPYTSIILLPTTTTTIANSATSGIELEAIDNNSELANIKIGPNPASRTLSIFIQGFQKNKDLNTFLCNHNF